MIPNTTQLLDVVKALTGLEFSLYEQSTRDVAVLTFATHLSTRSLEENSSNVVGEALRDFFAKVESGDWFQGIRKKHDEETKKLNQEVAFLKEKIEELKPYQIHYNLEVNLRHGPIIMPEAPKGAGGYTVGNPPRQRGQEYLR